MNKDDLFRAVDAANRAAADRQSKEATIAVAVLGALALAGFLLYLYAEANW